MKRLFILTILISTILLMGQVGFAQVADTDYDWDGTTDLDAEAGTTLIHDLDVIKERAIDNIIRRIRKGDTNVLKFVVYDVLAEVHRKVVRTVDESIDPKTGKATTDYYQVLGDQAAIHAFIGGFDNQDPKVRLRCIGYLGDWVNDIGEQLPLIGKAANDRLNSAIETREEVKYGLELLQLKVLRKIDLNAIFKGDERKLAEISPDEFVVLVHGEPFIRQIFCVPPDVILRSIRLNPWWIDDMGFISMKDEAEEGEKANSRAISHDSFPPYRMKLVRGTSIYRNYPEDAATEKRYGYKDRAGYLDIVSLYDWRFFRYQGIKGENKHANEDRYVPAIFMGIKNPSLFVRENCARVLVRLTDGPLPYDPTNPAAAGAGATFEDVTVVTDKPWEIKNAEGQVVGVHGIIGQLAQNQRYRDIVKEAWQNVKFAQFIDVHQGRDPIIQTRELNPTAGAINIRDVDPNHGSAASKDNPWGYTYTYRTDVADLMRRMGLGRMVDTCAAEEVKIVAESAGRRYFVEDLMDLDALAPNQPVPNWHGKDRIKDEVFEY